jgi:hypothetical protein
MSSSAFKRKLSGSTDGKGIKITQTSTAGNAIHTAVAGTTAGTYDEVWLWAQNNHTADVALTVEFGAADTEHNIIVNIPYKAGLVPVVPGLPLQNEATVKAFAGTADVITVHGFVNSMTD